MLDLSRRIEWIKAGENPYFVKEPETGYVVVETINAGLYLISSKGACQNSTIWRLLKTSFSRGKVWSEAVAKAFKAEKMNIELLGNGDAHAHWHLFPRRSGDMRGHGLNGRGPVWWCPGKKWRQKIAK